MPEISREDIRSLERKIQAEVRKILTQFQEDLEQKNAHPEDPAKIPALQGFGEPEPEPANPVRVPAKPRKRRSSKKLTEMSNLLTGSANDPVKSPAKILEEDMNKIFRKRHRRSTARQD